MLQRNVVADNLGTRLKTFQHPVLDNKATEVLVEHTESGMSILKVKLYGQDGAYVIEDRPLGPNHSMPGLLLTVNGIDQSLWIESAYIKSDYQGQHIGTDFVTYLEQSARATYLKRISLVADDLTSAFRYWSAKHGFIAVDETRPFLMEKRLD